MNGAQFFAIIEPIWRGKMAQRIPPAVIDQFLAEEKGGIVAVLDQALAERRVRLAQKTQAVDDPPEFWTKARRTRANLEALRLIASKKPEDLTPAERRILLAYSGWGGLSIERVRDEFPAGLEPEDLGLVHEYYTPLKIADEIAAQVCLRLPELVGHDGVVRILEPSVGIGRFPRATGRPSCIDPAGPVRRLEWVTVEFSKVSSRLFAALRPDVTHYNMPFERFVRLHSSEYTGRIHVVLTNPPYGQRGEYAAEDTNPSYRERAAYPYFMRRAFDMLVPGGLGVALVPSGFLTGERNRELRGRILARHHLAAAFRLPSHLPSGREVFPGASVVVDVLFFRSRGGELTAIDESDRFILDGKYFEQFPTHVLGTPEGEFAAGETGEEDKPKRHWRYKIVGEFTGIPDFEERPMCASCAVRVLPPEVMAPFETGIRTLTETETSTDEVVRAGVELGRRIDRYLAAVAANDADRAEGLWVELRAALLDFRARSEVDKVGGPWRYEPLRAHAQKGSATAQQLLNAFTPQGDLAPAVADPPKVWRRYTGSPDDALAQAEHLFRSRRRLTLSELHEFHRQVGGALSDDALLARLLEAKWNVDDDQLVPLDVYVTGSLWPKYDRARAKEGDPQAALQVRRLLEAIGPAVFEDIGDITPSQRWVPLPLIAAWISQVYNRELGPIQLERAFGLVQIRGSNYGRTEDLPGLSAEAVWILGWINHDKRLFAPDDEDADPDDRKKTAERRAEKSREYAESFHNWLRDDPERRQAIADAYSREFRGIITPEFSSDPLPIARWGERGPVLKAHQVAGARRVLTLRRGLIAFDVGVGKTYTAIAVVARARQEGWVRRAVILVPSSLVWKWYDDIRCCLPDYQILVIGSNRKRITRGKRKGYLTSETDTPEERAKKWQAFQAGQADVVILSFDAFARTKISEDAVVEYAKGVEAIRRKVALEQERAEERRRKKKKLTERQKAILQHGVRAFVQDYLKLPKNQRYDPGIAWDDLGIQMLVVDEAGAFKNLYMPEAREAGIPKFMGGSGKGSRRAWQLDFRTALIRKHTGGSGVVLLTATPAKNSPLEFYSLIQMIDPAAFSTRLGDPEQFIDRYLQIELRQVLRINFRVEKKSAVVGFKNLEELRNIIRTYGEFRTAAEVGVPLPTPRVELVEVDMDDAQEAKYVKYIRQIEQSLGDPTMGSDVLGLLGRMSAVALHSALDEGYNWSNALTGGDPGEDEDEEGRKRKDGDDDKDEDEVDDDDPEDEA